MRCIENMLYSLFSAQSNQKRHVYICLMVFLWIAYYVKHIFEISPLDSTSLQALLNTIKLHSKYFKQTSAVGHSTHDSLRDLLSISFQCRHIVDHLVGDDVNTICRELNSIQQVTHPMNAIRIFVHLNLQGQLGHCREVSTFETWAIDCTERRRVVKSVSRQLVDHLLVRNKHCMTYDNHLF